MDTEGDGAPRQPPDVRRPALLDTIVGCLAEPGASGTSTRAIAVRARVAPGLLAHYFGSKEQMLEAAYRHLSDTLVPAGAQALAEARTTRGPSSGVPRRRLSPTVSRPGATHRTGGALEPGRNGARTSRGARRVLPPLSRPTRVAHRASRPVARWIPIWCFAVSAPADGLWLDRSAGERTYDVDAMLKTAMRLIEAPGFPGGRHGAQTSPEPGPRLDPTRPSTPVARWRTRVGRPHVRRCRVVSIRLTPATATGTLSAQPCSSRGCPGSKRAIRGDSRDAPMMPRRPP